MNVRCGLAALLAPTVICLLAMPSARAETDCAADRAESAHAMVKQAQRRANPVERAIQLKRALQVCENAEGWIELGRAELDLENVAEAVYAFEKARDVLMPDVFGEFGRAQLRLRTLGNAWLAESYRLDGELALAVLAVQEAQGGFEMLGEPAPGRLMQLQAELDDELAAAEESVLTRSLELQHERGTRGIGVRPVVRDEPDPPELVDTSEALALAYDESAPAADEVAAATTEAATASPADEADGAIESRLNIPVLFGFDSAVLAADSERTIERLGRAIGQLDLSARDRVRILGHTDRRGDAAYNLALSEQRAQSVLERLDGMAVTPAVLDATGLGEQQLRYRGDSPDDHRRNRRVEVVVVRP